MSLDLSAVGFKTEPHEFEYDWKAVVLYALGIGARRRDLHWVYEQRGPRVFPTFPIISAYPTMTRMLERVRAPLSSVVHFGQTIRVLGQAAPNGVFTTTGTLRGVYDLKRMAKIVFETHTTQDGQPICEMEWSLLALGEGGFGGPRPPKTESVTLPKAGPADFEQTESTSPEQALLYRLSGDLNPLHVDPDVARTAGFEQGPILHGLCTLGFLARAVVQSTLDGDERRLLAISAQFKKPVWPGESIRTLGYRIEPQTYALTAYAADRPDPIVSNCWAKISN